MIKGYTGRVWIFILIMAMIMSISVIFPTGTAQAAIQMTYYVSPDGDDNDDGTLSAPFKTIQKARDVIRTINSNMTGDIVVYLLGGRYDLSSTLTFNENDGGTNSYYINYLAYNNETPVISGGKRVTGWTQVSSKNYYVADVPTSSGYADYFRQLYVNGVRAYRASSAWITGVSYYNSPNTSQASDGINFNPSDLKASYTNVTDIRLLHINSFKVDEWPVVNTLDNGSYKAVQCGQPHFQIRADRGYLAATDKFMIVNAFEELDKPGEWYHDRTADKVYYYPYSTEDMSTCEIYAPALDSDQIVKLEGSSITNLVQNIKFEGITFEHGNWLFPKDYFIGGTQAEILYLPSDGVYGLEVPGNILLNHTSGIQFIKNTVRHMGGCGIHLYNDVSDTTVQGNIFHDTTGAGVLVGRFNGAYIDNDILHEGRVKDNLIDNNVIRDTGRDYMQATGISIMPALRTTVTHNDLDNSAYMGIHSRMVVHGNYSTHDTDVSLDIGSGYIAFNKVSESNWSRIYGVNDNASIYNFGPAKDTEIYQNYILDSSANKGLYNDDNSYRITWRQNVNLEQNNMSDRSVDPTTILFDGNYGTKYGPNSANCVLTNYTRLSSADMSTWPTLAQNIANNAGLQSDYNYLLNNVPVIQDYNYLNEIAVVSNEQNIFTTQTPVGFDNAAQYELGTRFKSNVNGNITKVRIYTGSTEGGDHTVRIWRVSDSTVMSGPYTWNITAGTTGWKEFTLPSALTIAANTDYIVAVSSSTDKYYARTQQGFYNPINNGNLITYTGSGVYTTALGSMPTNVAHYSNYFRDIVFVPNEQNIFTTQTPVGFDDAAQYELGTRFKANVNGIITRVRIYTGPTEGGDHTVRIWRVSDGTLVSGPYTWNITAGASGWKEFSLPSVLSITANTDYIVAVSSSSDKYYSRTQHGFDNPVNNGNLITYTGSGVYTNALGSMPTNVAHNSNYFRDIVFVAQ